MLQTSWMTSIGFSITKSHPTVLTQQQLHRCFGHVCVLGRASRFPTCTSVVWHIWCNPPLAHLVQPTLGTFAATHPRHICCNPSSIIICGKLHNCLWQITQLLNMFCVTPHTLVEQETRNHKLCGLLAPQWSTDWRVCTAIAASVFALRCRRSNAHNRIHWTQPLPQHNLCRAYWSDNGFADCVSGRQIGYV